MQFSLATIAALAGLAAAVPHNHAQFHKKDLLSEFTSEMTSILGALGIKLPVNSQTNNGQTWVGSEGPIVHTVVNKAAEAVTVVFWGNQGSWVNSVQPLIAQVIPAGENATFSHAMGSGWTPNVGGMAAIFNDTKLVNGQISETWMEYSFTNDMYSSSTYDVSREVNMAGHNLTVQGPKCRSDMDTCVFKCKDASQTTCGAAGSYELVNCEAGSQEGATSGTFMGQASGGCQGIANEGITNLVSTLE